MIQLIAVHVGGALPVVMEFETGGLNHVQKHALEHLPRSPSGVPEVRGLGKADDEVQFKFKVAFDKVSSAGVPEMPCAAMQKLSRRYPSLMGQGLLKLPVEHITRDSHGVLALRRMDELAPPNRLQTIETHQSACPSHPSRTCCAFQRSRTPVSA